MKRSQAESKGEEERATEGAIEEGGGEEGGGKNEEAEGEIQDDSGSDINKALERQLLDLLGKRYKGTGGVEDKELERHLMCEIRIKYDRKKEGQRQQQLQ